MSRVAVVTGANKGIGYAIARMLGRRSELRVILTSRSEELGLGAVQKLKNEDGVNVEYHQCDLLDHTSIQRFADHLRTAYGGLDILVNNAGTATHGDAFDGQVVRQTLATNYYGTRDVTSALLPLVRAGGRVCNVASMAGCLKNLSADLKAEFQQARTNMTAAECDKLMERFQNDVDDGTFAAKGWPKQSYAVSKIGVNALTFVTARDPAVLSRSILVNSCCPGYCDTDMTSHRGPRTIDQGAKTPVHVALLPDGGPTGEFWRDEKVAGW